MKQVYLVLKTSVKGVRLAALEGRDHVVVPVVALVQGVIHASNSSSPELVLAEEFSRSPETWNGRPVMLDHPVVNGRNVSANHPDVLGKWRIGQVFNAHVEDDKLLMEAWLDPDRAAEVGEDAVNLLETLRSGERMVEVSVGAFVNSEEQAGEYKGKRYAAVWRDIMPDHLAMLPEAIGACSINMGCGAPRVAATKEAAMTLREKFLALVAKFQGASEGVADSDLRGMLDRALFAGVPGYLGIVGVFQADSTVVYATAPDGQEVMFQRGYTLNEDSTVTLSDDTVEVSMVTKFEPVTVAASACGCSTRPETPPAVLEDNVNKKQRVEAIIASGKTCFTAASQAALESLPDSELDKLESHIAAATEQPAPAPAAAPAAQPTPAAAPAVTEIAGVPLDEATRIVTEHRAAQAKAKNDIIGELVAAQTVYSQAELTAMDTAQLEKIRALAVKKPADFSATGTAPRAAAEADDVVPAPPSLAAKVVALRSVTK